jgi:hypothetical protein
LLSNESDLNLSLLLLLLLLLLFLLALCDRLHLEAPLVEPEEDIILSDSRSWDGLADMAAASMSSATTITSCSSLAPILA